MYHYYTRLGGWWEFAAPRQGRFANRAYGDCGGLWDAGGNYGAGLRPLRRDVDDGIANVVRSRGDGAWIPAPYRGTGQALRGNDEVGARE